MPRKIAQFAEEVVCALIFALVLSCATLRDEPRGWRGCVDDVKQWRTSHGDIYFEIVVSFDHDGIHDHAHGFFKWGSREQMLFGVPGREVCVMRVAGGVRFDTCRD